MPQKEEPIVVPENTGLAENVPMEELGNEKEYYFTNQGEIEKEIIEVKEQEIESGSLASKEEGKDQEKEEEEETIVNVAEDEEENDVWPNDDSLIEQKEDDEVGNGVMSTEELNKKFDEFIRRMKEELRIEAQRQLIMV